ncbi:MAG: cytochrome c peroxidase [Roseiarcus sp.]|jgi:cytochrome c peroxidase
MKRKVGIIVAALCLLGGAGWAKDGAPADRRASLGDFRPPGEIPYPDDNPYSPAKADLGDRLFFDPLLSKSQGLSCASCHDPDRAWTDGRAKALGEDPAGMALRTPTLLDVAWLPRLGWDGKYRDLESVAFTPITSVNNMNLGENELFARLSARPDYVAAFAEAFADGAISRRNVEMALATFERSIVAEESPFDRWVAGDEQAVDEPVKRGFELFNGKGRCSGCHSGWTFSDGSFHDIGMASGGDIGRGRMFPSSVKLRYAFKTPTLRDVARRGPYMHDGSVPTLAAVVDLYDRGGIDRPSRSELVGPLGLTEAEKTDLLAFLDSLTGTPPLRREFGALP